MKSSSTEISISSLARGIRGVSYKPYQLKVEIDRDSLYLLRSNNIQRGRIDFHDVQIVDKDCVSENQRLIQDDIIVCMSNGSRPLVGKSALFKTEDEKYCVGAFCSTFRVNKDIDPNFVFQVFQSREFKNKIDVILSGSAINNLQNKHIEELKFNLPNCKQEQTRIASILSTADAAIDQTEKLIAKYQRIKTGLMHDLLTKGIDERGNIRSKGTHRFVVKNGVEVPEGCEVNTLGTFCKSGIQTGPFGSQLHSDDYKEEGIPIITVEHLKNSRISHFDIPLVGKEDYIRLKKYQLQEGDLVFSRVGAIDRCSITTEHENGWLFSGRCLRVRSVPVFDPFFLLFQLNFEPIRNQILNAAVGSTMKCLNTSILSNIIVVKPPIIEQEQIAEKIKEIDLFIDMLSKKEYKLCKLKQGLMQDLLSGRVRVN